MRGFPTLFTCKVTIHWRNTPEEVLQRWLDPVNIKDTVRSAWPSRDVSRPGLTVDCAQEQWLSVTRSPPLDGALLDPPHQDIPPPSWPCSPETELHHQRDLLCPDPVWREGREGQSVMFKGLICPEWGVRSAGGEAIILRTESSRPDCGCRFLLCRYSLPIIPRFTNQSLRLELVLYTFYTEDMMRGRHVWSSVCLLLEVFSWSHYSLEWTFCQQEYTYSSSSPLKLYWPIGGEYQVMLLKTDQ